MKYYIIAGEPSGDLHGANLIKGLLKCDIAAEFRFWGGDKMSQASGMKPVKHYKEASVMGFWEVLKNLRKISSLMELCKADIISYVPDVLILIDYPGFNLRMAEFAKKHGIKVYYYIAPKVWAWKEGRVKKLQKYVDELFVIFPFEIDYFAKFGIKAHYSGNPLLDEIESRQTPDFAAFCKENGLTGKPIIALVAGSRTMEIEHNLPYMVAVAKRMPEFEFVVTAVGWLDKALYNKYLDGSTVAYVCDKTYQTIALSSGALVTSGTATLETALLGVPQVVCYRAPSVSMWIAKRLVDVKWISLVNLVMDRSVVKELIQNDFTVENAMTHLNSILPNGQNHTLLMENYRQLDEAMGGVGASERVALNMYELLKK